ncbi:hypothetical protein BT93_G0512 [Corymbia citriodora subsp. variegata]|nr:hypothetical protein BT93_G0512 [Corymbia citriodora subsp. variegata]
MSADPVVDIGWDVLKSYVVVPIERGFGYVFSSKRFSNDLRGEVQNLENEDQRVKDLAEQARCNVRELHSVFTMWEESAEKALKEARDLLVDFENATKTCCYGTLPDPKCRYQFSRKAEGKIEVIKGLTKKCSEFRVLNDICSSAPAPGNVAAPNPAKRKGKDAIQSTTTATTSVFSASTSLKLRDDGVLESRALMIRKIMDALADDSNSVVGIHGMGGVGKSTLLADIKSRIREEKSFDWVAKADVSENPDIKKIQGEIADALGLTDIKNKEYVSGRAELLHERLKEESENKKVLIILDNLWKGLDLKSVGIPCGRDNKVIGCKLLLTSRDRLVLRREMRCDKAILLHVLVEQEAKRLFETMVGGKVHVEFEHLVDEALRKSAGLPFLICAMAKLFIDANLSELNDALNQIELSADGDISAVINDVLRLSYDRLESEEAKNLLKLCAAYGVSKPSVENLVRFGYGWGIFQKDSSMKEARDRLNRLIYTLQASSLLLDNGEADGFKIHDLVRDFVSRFILRDHPLLLLEDKDTLATQLRKERLKNCMAICFPYIDMKELPEELDCPELQIFLLFRNNESLEVPDSYFNSMRKLVVLNLTSIRLTCSPAPFQLSENLHTLCLQSCSLEDVAILGKLKGLQILSFMGSKIQLLPKEIGQLVELRLLDLTRCPQLKIIEPGVLRSLIKLEELYVENSFDQWNADEQTPTNASLIELNHMKNLSTLHVSIPDLSVLPGDLNVEKLTKYKIQIGHLDKWNFWRYLSKYRGSRTLELKLNPTSNILQKGYIRTTLDRVDDLWIIELNGIEESICQLSPEGFSQLKSLHVQNGPSIHYILKRSSLTAFKMLEMLFLENLISLEKLCHKDISFNPFRKLKVIRVKSCDKMEVLFPCSVVRELPQLEEIDVDNCESMCGIVEADDCGKFELPNLRVLKLRGLPNMKNIFTARSAPLSSTSNDHVGTQIAFFNGQQVAFQRLEKLEIICLDNLEFLFSPSMVKSFTQLKELTVWSCEKMEAIIMEEEGLGMETSEILAFPMLTDLCLERLKSLTCFFNGKCAQESRSQNRVRSCATTLFNQEYISIAFPIWSHRHKFFQHMKTLDVSHCHGLSNMFTPTMAANLVELTKLRISKCEILTEVISDEGGKEGHVVAFNQLKYMELDGLARLRCFSSGGYTLNFPLLEEVITNICPKMRFFSEGPMEAPKLERVQVCLDKGYGAPKYQYFWEGNLNMTIQNMFEEMATFTAIKFMRLSEFPELIGKWHNELNPIKSFWQLESLVVDKCPSFINAMPSSLILVLERMTSLKVFHCELLEEIFDLEGLEAVDCTRVLPQLQNLCLVNLPKLRQLWNRDLEGMMRFKSLKHLSLYKCSNLRQAFVPSMARCLPNLCGMEIKECEQMEGVIVDEEGQESAVEEITFPNLDWINLECLPNLTSFLSWKNQMLECPILTELSIAYCPKMRSLTWQSSMEIDNGTHSLFTPQLKLLSVNECKKLVNVDPSFILGWLKSLETLTIEACESLEVVFKLQALNPLDGHHVAHSPLKKLELYDLPKLNRVWDRELHRQVKFQCLRWVSLRGCARLTSLFLTSIARDLIQLEELEINKCGIVQLIGREGPNEPSIDVEAIEGSSQVESSFPSYFQHMKTIDVSHCHGLSNMFTPTIAKNLVEITKLRISKCDILTEVISDEGGNEGHVVAFNQLKHLELDGLTQMRCFSSGGYTLILPLLEDIITNRCPKMKFFFKGPMEAPKLKRVRVGLKRGYEATEYPYFWKGNVNMTIQNMFEEMFMRLFEFSELIGKWHSELNPITSSWQLKSLVVGKCPSFINAIPSSLMLVLEKLTALQVRDCKLLEEIFDLKGLEAVDCTQALPQLQYLCLVNLPKLKQLWNRDLQGMMCFNSLQHLRLYKCSNLRHAFVPSMARCLPNLCGMEIKECEQMEGVIVDEEGQESAVEEITFPNLDRINLECLPNLISFLLWKNQMLECPILTKLSIAYCPKMRSLTWQSSMEIDNGTHSLFTPQLASSLCTCMRGFQAITRTGVCWLWWVEVDLRCGSDFGVDSVRALILAKKSKKNLGQVDVKVE